MDYSLLLGCHFCDDVSASWAGSSPCSASTSKLIFLIVWYIMDYGALQVHLNLVMVLD